jgi:hypothetical protein
MDALQAASRGVFGFPARGRTEALVRPAGEERAAALAANGA